MRIWHNFIKKFELFIRSDRKFLMVRKNAELQEILRAQLGPASFFGPQSYVLTEGKSRVYLIPFN